MKRKLILTAFFLSGFAALMYEIAYTRGIALTTGSSIYSYSIMLAAFLSGMGFGSLIAKKFIDKIKPAPFFTYLQLAIALYGLFFIPILNNLDLIYIYIYQTASKNFFVFNIMLVMLSYLVLLIPALFMGMTFPVVTKIVARLKHIGKDIGDLFSVNTLGGIFGSFAAGFILLPLIGLEKTIFLAALLNIFVSLLVFVFFKKDFNKTNYFVSLAIIIVVTMFSFNFNVDPYRLGIYYGVGSYDDIDNYKSRLEEQRFDSSILFSDYGLYGSVIVTERKGVKTLLINGKADAGTGGDVPT